MKGLLINGPYHMRLEDVQDAPPYLGLPYYMPEPLVGSVGDVVKGALQEHWAYYERQTEVLPDRALPTYVYSHCDEECEHAG